MTLSNIIHSANSGLLTSQAALRTVSNNISNVNTPGYSREQVVFEANAYGGQVAGVKIGQIRRVTDQFLEKAVYDASGGAGQFSILQQFHNRLQGFIGSSDSESSITARLDSIFTSISTLTSNAGDPVRRQGVIDSISRFTEEVEALSSQIQALRADASNQAVETVETINDLLARIHELNPRIVQTKVTNGNATGLEEQRAQALEELASLIDIRTIENGDGSLQVVTANGTTLLDHSLYQLDYQSPGVVVPGTTFPQIRVLSVHPGSGAKTDTGIALDGNISSGKLKGLLDLRDRELPALAESLGEMARAFVDEMNAVHNANSAVPAPNALTGRQTGLLGTDPHGFTGTSTFAVVDQAGAVVAKTSINFSALPANATINDVVTLINTGLGGAGTATFANGQLSIKAANGANGVVVADDAAAPSSRGGRGFSHFFGLNDLIVTKQNGTFATGVTGANAHGFTAGGTMQLEVRDASNRIVGSYALTVGGGSFNDLLTTLNAPGALGNYMTFSLDAQGQLVAEPKPGYSGAGIHVVSDSTSRGGTGVSLSDFFGLGTGAQADVASGLSIRPDIASNPFKLGLARFDTNAAVGATALGAGDQRGANAFFELSTKTLTFGKAGDLAPVSATLSEYMGFMVGDAAMKARRADMGVADATTLLTTVVQRRDDFSGVNLDEELSNMIVFQNSYSAAARLITTAKEMYDTLLAVAQ